MSETLETEFFEGWAIIELMGRRQLSGKVTQVTVAGSAMLRIDVPPYGDHPGFTTCVGGGSIYSLTPVDEQTALDYASIVEPVPVERYSVQQTARVAAEREFNRMHHQAGLPMPAEASTDVGSDEDDSFDDEHDSE